MQDGVHEVLAELAGAARAVLHMEGSEISQDRRLMQEEEGDG